MQAKDIPAGDVLALVAQVQATLKRWAHTSDVFERFPAAPRKVVLAKLSSLIKRKLITGCACGCYGGFELTDAGREHGRGLAVQRRGELEKLVQDEAAGQ